ncbi:MAG: cytochrome c oxidase accessory protein CcoG [Devosia sp.]
MLADPPAPTLPDPKPAKPAPLYAPRRKIFPKRADGAYRRFKWLVMGITLAIYYVTPWIRWYRGPYAPDQAVLVDLANRRFFFFFIEIWPQEFYYVAGLLVMAGIGLFLVTSTVGRAWCGYACPQTVWVDLFIAVENFIEGDRNARMKLEAGPWTIDKLWKRVAKHSTWLVIAVLTGGAWIFYFADAPRLIVDVVSLHAPFVAYSTIAILTATTYVFGGLMREQVCTYMCPWPRIQGAMLDEYSLTVTYNGWRGEPRSRHAKKAAAEGKTVGDCVDCNACVVVCPMGIDIRDGQQLECITCALCIDACDDIMVRLGKDRGLISYATLYDHQHNTVIATGPDGRIDPGRVRDTLTGKLVDTIRLTNWRSIIRPRTIVYTIVLAAIGMGMLTALALRTPISVTALHDRNPLFVVMRDGAVSNGYDIKIANMTPEPRQVTLAVDGLPGATLSIAEQGNLTPQTVQLSLEPDRVLSVRAFVQVARDAVPDTPVRFVIGVASDDGRYRVQTESNFEIPVH